MDLPAPGRADHQQVMSAGCGDLQRALGALLSLDVAQIELICGCLAHSRLRAREHLGAPKMVGDLDQRVGRDDLDVGARPGGLRAAGGRADQSLLARIGADRGRQHARDRRDRPVKTELAEHREARQRVRRDRADRGHQPERDWKVVVAAFLGQIGGREIDGDASCRQREPRGDQRRAYALARFRDRLVGEPHNMEGRQAGRDLDLHVHRTRLDPLKGYGRYPLNHAVLPPSFANPR